MTWPATIDPAGMDPPRPVIFGEVLFDCFGDDKIPGGAPLNVAWHLHALGWHPLLISRVGDDEPGRKMIARMHDWGMDTTGIQQDTQHPTGRVEVAMDEKSHTFEILAEQAYDHIDPEEACSAAGSQRCGILYHGSLALRGNSRAALDRLSEAVEAPVFLDINLREPWWKKNDVLEMIKRAGILKLNDDELELLLPANLVDTSLEAAIQTIRKKWELDAVWLTMGKKGAVYVSSETNALRVQPDDHDAPVVDTVGAGDAFSAALLGGFLNNASPENTAACAVKLATRICGQQGATVADMDVYQGLEAVTNG